MTRPKRILKVDIDKLSDEDLRLLRGRLKANVGKPMKYKGLCEALGINIASSDSKSKQLKELSLLCNIEIGEKPTRYTITEVFEEELLPGIHANNKFQEPMEYILLTILKQANFNNLYFTNSQLLRSLYLVNDNYVLLKNNKKRFALEKATGESYWEIYKDASKAGEILMRWVNRALERMEKRSLLFYRRGFCLLKRENIEGDKFISVNPVPLGSPLERQLLGLYAKAIEDCGGSSQSDYIPPALKAHVYKRFDALVVEALGENYMGGYKCNVITPAKEANLARLDDLERILNDEAKRKIVSTTTLDYMTGKDRKRLVNELIALPPASDYQGRLGR